MQLEGHVMADAEQGAIGGTPGFVHLRVHSAYSLLEGALPLKKILYKAAGDSQPAIAITDTNNLFVALEFSQKAMDDGLQPIIGCQVSIDMPMTMRARLVSKADQPSSSCR